MLEGDGTCNSSYHYGGWALVAGLALIPYVVLSTWLLRRFYRRKMRWPIVLYILLPLILIVIYNYIECGSRWRPGGSVVVSSTTIGWHTYAANWEPGIITFHGSWNRSISTVYKIVLNTKGQVQDFATNWLVSNDTAIGGPSSRYGWLPLCY